MTRPPVRAVVTVGMFDGVHAAHQRLINAVVRLARRINGTSIALTFDPDPQLVLDPAHAPPALMPLSERVSHVRALGVDMVWVIPFTKRFAEMTAEDFITRVLVGRLHASALVVGETFAFGRNRHGNMTVLQRLGPRHGMRIVSMREMTRQGRVISSSHIRGLIAAGRLAAAARLLGRPPALYGVVVRGAGRGRRLGFPTANIRLIPQVLPPQGVYAVLVHEPSRRRHHHGVMNLGVRPTFGPGPLVCEVHLLGFSGALLGQPVSVSLLARLRGERRFPSPAALVRQVRQDLRRAHRVFARLS